MKIPKPKRLQDWYKVCASCYLSTASPIFSQDLLHRAKEKHIITDWYDVNTWIANTANFTTNMVCTSVLSR